VIRRKSFVILKTVTVLLLLTVYILGTDSSGNANTVMTWRGDGLVPAPNQLFTTIQGFGGIRIRPLVVATVPPLVVHTDEPSQILDLIAQLKIIAPGWFP
jgi:hypothetical protein